MTGAGIYHGSWNRIGRVMMLKKTVNMILISGAIVSLVACNTVRGAGEDVQSAANAVDNKT